MCVYAHACVMHVRVHIYMHTQRPEEDVSCLSLQLCLIESGLLTELEAHRFVSAGWPVSSWDLSVPWHWGRRRVCRHRQLGVYLSAGDSNSVPCAFMALFKNVNLFYVWWWGACV